MASGETHWSPTHCTPPTPVPAHRASANCRLKLYWGHAGVLQAHEPSPHGHTLMHAHARANKPTTSSTLVAARLLPTTRTAASTSFHTKVQIHKKSATSSWSHFAIRTPMSLLSSPEHSSCICVPRICVNPTPVTMQPHAASRPVPSLCTFTQARTPSDAAHLQPTLHSHT